MNDSEHTTVTVSGFTSLSYSFEKSLMSGCGLAKVQGGPLGGVTSCSKSLTETAAVLLC